MNDSKVIRLNRTCINSINYIRDKWIDGFKDSKLKPNDSFFSDVYIIYLALNHYINYLDNDKEEVL